MRTTHLLPAGGLVLVLAGLTCADPKPQEAIVGKWGPQDPRAKGKASIEFFKDGKVKAVFSDITGHIIVNGTYKFVGEDTVEVKLTIGNDAKTTKAKVKVTDKEMEFTPSGGATEKYNRLK